MKNQKGSALALLPLIIFVVSYLGMSLILDDFYAVSILVPGLLAAIVALFMNRKIGFEKSLEHFCKGAGNSNIILMCLIFILAGAFAKVASSMGAVESTVKIATAIAEKTTLSLPLIVGAVVGGAMFGDNLSIISDTTIAATRTQGCNMRDKFRMNFKVVLPAALISIVLYIILGSGAQISSQAYDYSLIKVVPYLAILISALAGVNVIIVLSGGIGLAAIIGFMTGSMDVRSLFNSISTGISGMSELIIISLIIGGIVELIKVNGGIEFILNAVTSKIKTKMGAEIGIGVLVSIIDVATANNTIAIVTVGPIAKDISDKYDLDPKRVAGILDMFSCVFQGLIPYGAQLLTAASLAGLAPFEIMKYLFYPYLMGVSAVIFITIFSKRKVLKVNKELVS